MKKEFVSYEQAIALKELGFNEPCLGAFFKENLKFFDFHNNLTGYVNDNKLIIGAPLKQQVFKWFREEYGLEGIVQRAEDKKWYKYSIYKYSEDSKIIIYGGYEADTHEEAESSCIDRLIELAKQQNNGKRIQ